MRSIVTLRGERSGTSVGGGSSRRSGLWRGGLSLFIKFLSNKKCEHIVKIMVSHVMKGHVELFLSLFEQDFLMFQSATQGREMEVAREKRR